MSPGQVRSVLVALSMLASACTAGAASTTTTSTSTTSTTTTTSTTSTTTSTITTAIATTTTTAGVLIPCTIEAPGPEYDTTFYAKQCIVLGVPVLSSAAVADAAHDEAAIAIVGMLSDRPDLIGEMLDSGLRVGIIGETELTTDLPEYADLYEQFPGTDWNTRTRGLGATLFIPLSSAGEENLLCLTSDVYFGESIFVHEFAHTIRILGIAPLDREMDLKIEQAYEAAVAEGRWVDTYAITNSDEYWAEAVQSYFDTNASATPTNGIHNDVDTNGELAAYDPLIHGIIDEVFAGTTWRYQCP